MAIQHGVTCELCGRPVDGVVIVESGVQREHFYCSMVCIERSKLRPNSFLWFPLYQEASTWYSFFLDQVYRQMIERRMASCETWAKEVNSCLRWEGNGTIAEPGETLIGMFMKSDREVCSSAIG